MKFRWPWQTPPSDAQREIAERTAAHEKALDHADLALEETRIEIRRTDRLLAEYAQADSERHA